MEIWEYDRVTGELIGQGLADPDPEQAGNWLIPAFATTIRPPRAPIGCVAVFDCGLTDQGSWRIALKDDDSIRQRLAPRIIELCAVIDRCCRASDLDREAAVRLVLEAAKETVGSLDPEGLRADAVALLQDVLAGRRPN